MTTAEECYGVVWVCGDCMYCATYGEYGDRPEDLPEPLSDLREGDRLTLGMGDEDHSCGVPFAEREECDCETIPFSQSACEGCSDWLHGERHAMTLWRSTTVPTA